jgi:hypothetical protein
MHPKDTRSKKTRRTFLATSLTTALGVVGCAALQRSSNVSSAVPTTASTDATPVSATGSLLPSANSMPSRALGRTNVQLPVLGLGTAGRTPLARSNQEPAAIAQIERALELGIRYFDTAASYGPSESFLASRREARRSTCKVSVGMKAR